MNLSFSILFNNRIENLIPLCANCHKEEHFHLRNNQGHLYTVDDYVERMKLHLESATPKPNKKVANFKKPNELLYLIKTAKMIDYINLTKEKLEKLEKSYRNAKKKNRIQFQFNNKLLLTDYAKHLINHIKKVNK